MYRDTSPNTISVSCTDANPHYNADTCSHTNAISSSHTSTHTQSYTRTDSNTISCTVQWADCGTNTNTHPISSMYSWHTPMRPSVRTLRCSWLIFKHEI